MHTMVYESEIRHKVAIVGVGGAGCNVVSALKGTCSMDTIAINTDKDALKKASADVKLYICKGVLHGEGAAGQTAMGKKCAEIHIDEIKQALSGYEKVFVVAGLGGGTGTGAAPAVIEAAQSQNIMTFAIAIKPFFFEGSRVEVAKKGYGDIRKVCPLSIAIDNDMVVSKLSDMTMDEAFAEVNSAIMAHIDACIANYGVNEDDTVTNDDGFDSFLESSPICAFTSA